MVYFGPENKFFKIDLIKIFWAVILSAKKKIKKKLKNICIYKNYM